MASLDVLLAHEDARDALIAAFKLSDRLGSALLRYLALFRPASRELTMDRLAKLVGELLPDIQAAQIVRNGKQHPAPLDLWIAALEQTVQARDAGRLTLPLKSHGYLYEIISNAKPTPGANLVHGAAGTAQPGQPPRARSKTLSAIAALEERIRG
ncbi:MAG: hypothetical protein ACOY5C_04820 [Pseudomonadota bacterium]